jgi:hypothetical protein
MIQSESPRVKAIQRVLQMNGCTIEEEKITPDLLPELCQNLTDAEKADARDLIEYWENTLEEYLADINYAINEIASLDPDLEDELEENRSDKEFAQRVVKDLRPALEKLKEIAAIWN